MQKFKKALLIVFMLVVGFNMSLSTMAATYSATTTDSVRVRTGPSTKSTEIDKLAKGAKITVIQTIKKGATYRNTKADMDFYQLNTGGFVAAKYVKLGAQKSTSTPKPTATPTSEPEIEEITAGDEEIEMIDNSDNNENNTGDEEPGIISVGEEDQSDEIVDEADQESALANGVKASKMIATSSVNIRELPTTDSDSIGVLSASKMVTVTTLIKAGNVFEGDLTLEDDWYRVNSGGYIMAKYLKEPSKTESTTKNVTSSKTVATAKSNAIMYSKPIALAANKGTLKKGKKMNVSATIKSGTTVDGTKAVGTWYKLSNGYYVKSSEVSVATEKTTKQQTVTQAVKYTIDVKDGITASESVRIRSTPSTSGSIMSLLTPGDQEIVEEIIKSGATHDGEKVSGTWYKVSSGGYVLSAYVKFDAEATITMNPEYA